ncbi:MAG: TetR/AcrR family transcriptional regulator [Proteobacteria bacterium]|nr:TetR/AcrR family transcriptional regulator [Pseudomonadota bacterium]
MTRADILEGRGKNPTEARRKPLQARALKRHEQILDITAELLEKVGVDDLTTILIARSLSISVGSLYHYFPNKVAILYALSQRWLDEITLALDDIDATLVDNENLQAFTEHCTDRLLMVYRRQRGILHLVQAMFSIPELRELDEAHDKFMINRFAKMFTRLGFELDRRELQRIARVYLELIHAISIEIIGEKGMRASRTTDDLKFMAYSLLSRYHTS